MCMNTCTVSFRVMVMQIIRRITVYGNPHARVRFHAEFMPVTRAWEKMTARAVSRSEFTTATHLLGRSAMHELSITLKSQQHTKMSTFAVASGSPSGIATTMTVTAMMNVFIISIQSLFFIVNAKESGSQPLFLTQLKIFPQPHGMHPVISRATLTSIAPKVRTAHAIPNLPILSAITSSFYCRGVGWASPPCDLASIIPETV